MTGFPTDREEVRVRLAAEARSLPDQPGVYLLKDHADHILYVGKAANLRSRVGSYFTRSVDLGPKKQMMLSDVESLDIIECDGEWQALLVESRLIKDTRPRFNELMTDDKTYPYLVVTTREAFPGVYITRTPGDERFRQGRIFGPFTSSGALRDALQLLQRVFRYRTCHLDINPDDPRNEHFRPCLLYAINQCSGPCGNKISQEAYRKDIDRFIRFLGSKRTVMIKELRTEMEQASRGREYEHAAILRDQLRAIEKLDEREKDRHTMAAWQPEVMAFASDPSQGLRSLQRILGLDAPIRWLEAIDIAHLQGDETVGSKVCFIDGRPFREQYRRFRVRTASNDDYASIGEVVSRCYRNAREGKELLPDVILIDGGRGQLSAAGTALGQIRPQALISLAKREELIYLEGRSEPFRLGRGNVGLKLCQAIRDEAHRFAQHYHHLLRHKKVIDR
jgi:excinuclease ABC subunit C